MHFLLCTRINKVGCIVATPMNLIQDSTKLYYIKSVFYDLKFVLSYFIMNNKV